MPPKRKNIINHGEDCSEDLYIKAHDTLMNKIFTNKKPLTKEDARNLKDLAVLSDAQFETIYGLYLEALKFLVMKNNLNIKELTKIRCIIKFMNL